MPNTSLQPIAAKSFDLARARHLLNRAGFGGPPEQVAALQAMGLDDAVDHLVDYGSIDIGDLPKPEYDADLMRSPSEEERMMLRNVAGADQQAMRDRLRAEFLRRQVEDRSQMNRLAEWWLGRMIATPRPLEEKLVLLWHGHFASNHRTVHDSYLLLKQQALFRKHANGNFAELAAGVIRDPAMIKFLNNDSNRKGHPNENLARELMELFTLGVGNYSEDDIKEGARALTGYAVGDNDFEFRQRQHDYGNKSILGQTGTFDGEDFLRVILSRPQCPIFVAYKLYKHFVGDIDDKPSSTQEAVIRQMAAQLSSQRYNMKPVLTTLFKSQHFYDAEIIGNQVKSPAQLLVGTVRTLGTPTRSYNVLTDAMNMMGQKLFDPPSVAGWDGGRGWINTSTLFVRQNIAAYLVSGKLPFDDGWSIGEVAYDPSFLVKDLPQRGPGEVATRLVDTLIGPQAPQVRRDQLAAFLQSRGEIKNDTLIGLLLLVTAMPEYQLC